MDNDGLVDVRLDDFEDFKEGGFHLQPGVYVFLDAKGQAVYVGQSQHIPTRVKQHRSKAWFSDDLTVKTFRVEKEEDRLVVETAVILRLRPRRNRMIKLGIANTGRVYEMDFRKPVPKKR